MHIAAVGGGPRTAALTVYTSRHVHIAAETPFDELAYAEVYSSRHVHIAARSGGPSCRRSEVYSSRHVHIAAEEDDGAIPARRVYSSRHVHIAAAISCAFRIRADHILSLPGLRPVDADKILAFQFVLRCEPLSAQAYFTTKFEGSHLSFHSRSSSSCMSASSSSGGCSSLNMASLSLSNTVSPVEGGTVRNPLLTARCREI